MYGKYLFTASAARSFLFLSSCCLAAACKQQSLTLAEVCLCGIYFALSDKLWNTNYLMLLSCSVCSAAGKWKGQRGLRATVVQCSASADCSSCHYASCLLSGKHISSSYPSADWQEEYYRSSTVPASNHTNTEKTCRTNKPHGKCSSPLAIRLSFSLFLAPFTSHLFCQSTNIQRHTHFHVVMHYAMCFQWCFALLLHLFAFFLSALWISVFREEELCSLVFWQACHGFCFLFTVPHFGHCCPLLVVLPFITRFLTQHKVVPIERLFLL